MQLQDTGKKVGANAGAIAHSIDGACAAANVGRSSIYEAIKSGDLVARKLGRRTVIMDVDLRAWLTSLPRATSSAA